MRFLFVSSIAAALLAPAALTAQTVTVNKTATPDATTFNTISDALAAVNVDAAEPNVVQITDSGIYEEVISINTPVTLEGTGTDRPTIEVLGNAEGTGANGGILIDLPDTITSGVVAMRNLVILPATGVAPDSRLRTAIENRNNNLYLEIENCLITANNGNHEPLVTNGYVSDILKLVPSNAAYDPNVIPFGAHGIVLGRTDIDGTPQFEGEGVELVFKDSIITHLRNDYHPATVEPERFPTCIVVHNPHPDINNPDPSLTRITRILGESAVSYSRVGLSVVGDLEMRSDGEKIELKSAGNQALRLDGPALNFRTINNVNFSDNSQIGILDRGFGPIRFSMKDCTSLVTLNTIIRVETSGGPAVGQITIEDSTLVGGRHHSSAGKAHVFRFEVGTECDILFRNSILGGKLDHAEPIVPADPENITPAEQNLMDIRNNNVISFAGANTLTLEGTAVITQGPYSFRVNAEGESLAFSRGVDATLVGTPSVSGDPLFLNVDPSAPYEPTFLDVQNDLYATASAEGGPLGGGADFVGGISNVSDWAIY